MVLWGFFFFVVIVAFSSVPWFLSSYFYMYSQPSSSVVFDPLKMYIRSYHFCAANSPLASTSPVEKAKGLAMAYKSQCFHCLQDFSSSDFCQH